MLIKKIRLFCELRCHRKTTIELIFSKQKVIEKSSISCVFLAQLHRPRGVLLVLERVQRGGGGSLLRDVCRLQEDRAGERGELGLGVPLPEVRIHHTYELIISALNMRLSLITAACATGSSLPASPASPAPR